MANLYMPISAALISSILLIVYLSKERVKIKENNIYLAMLICVLLDSVLITVIYADAGVHETFTKLLNRFDYMMLVGWSSCLCTYSHFVIHKKDEERKEILHKLRALINIVTLVAFIIIWILRLDAVSEEGIVKAITGPAVYFTFGCCAINVVLCLIIVIFNSRKLTKQIVPLFSFMGIAGLCAVTYYFDPGISGVSMGLAMVNLTMYFTIENPDVQMLEEVKLAKEEAMRANQAKTDFLSSMSHEIRTPINAIMGFAECIQNDTTIEDAQADAKDIQYASQTLLELVNGILDISKIEAGRMEVVNKDYDPLGMSVKLSKLIKARIGDKPIELRCHFSEDIPGVVHGDEAKIRQIVTNLLTNAVKYTERGFIDFTIECTSDDDTAELAFIVQDTGHGIKPEDIDSLFDKFKRLEEDRNSNIEGTGLGLSITKQFVEMLGGTIDAQSVYGEGSTFTFKIPQPIISRERRTEEETVSQHKEYPGKRLLVVDDNYMNRVITKRLIELYKVKVEVASSGEECLQKCATETFDMILLDDMMPKLSGRQTLGKLKEIPDFSIPVVVYTANAIDGMREEYFNEGYRDYLSKPLVQSELRRVLERFLG